MNKILLIQYLSWHFLEMPKTILLAWKNYIYFNLNYFSVGTLLRTYFFYWRGYYYPYGKKWNPMRWLEAFIFNNIMSRLIGMIFRTVFIIVGLVLEIPILIGGLIILIGWLLLPVLLLMGLWLGFSLL